MRNVHRVAKRTRNSSAKNRSASGFCAAKSPVLEGGPSLNRLSAPEGAALTFHTHLKAPLILLHLLSPPAGLFLKGWNLPSFVLLMAAQLSLPDSRDSASKAMEINRGTILGLLCWGLAEVRWGGWFLWGFYETTPLFQVISLSSSQKAASSSSTWRILSGGSEVWAARDIRLELRKENKGKANNNCCHLLSPSHLSTLRVFAQWIITSTLSGKNSYPHLTDEELRLKKFK